jgi:F0F1-type ATP synthase gamma subunit
LLYVGDNGDVIIEVADHLDEKPCCGHNHIKRGKSASAAVRLVLGSDQGICGQFNDAIVQFATKEIF